MEKFVYLHLFEQHALNESALAMLHGKIERQINRIERDLPQIREENDEMVPLVRRIRQLCLDVMRRSRNNRIRQWYSDIKMREIIQDYSTHRARRDGSEGVVGELEELLRESDSPLFTEALETVIEQYRTWHDYNAHQMREVKREHPQLVELVEYTIANLVSLNMEMNILTEMRAKGIIAENVFADVYQYYDRLHLEKEDLLLHYRGRSVTR
ncbi:hypothetical protein HY839_01330 [Candidatus Azambacteria bacterium]|nr:hypothetical protein [Candidatus Azambacteria bacterium]